MMLHRRDAMIRLGQLGAGALTLPGLALAEQSRAVHPAAGGKAKSCILIYLWGGPPQMDMWDPNPEAPAGVRSLFKPIPTKVPGIHVSEEMPLFAKLTDKTAIIRSLTHDSDEHGNSVYYTLTGYRDPQKVFSRNHRNRHDRPGMGSVLSALRPTSNMPATVTIPRPIGHDGVTYSGTHAGFVGPRHDPLEIGRVGEETKADELFPLTLPDAVSNTRLLARHGLMQTLEDIDRKLQTDPATADHLEYRKQALGMLLTSKVKAALDINKETPQTRERYGRNEWGESILMARRLVESGVRLVTISWMYIQKGGNVANVWDNHGNFEGKTGYDMLKAEYCLPSLDRGFYALMEDLTQRGMLDETLVAMFGEFGRTPKINATAGRDHWGACQSAVLAGGGIRGGTVYGKSDKQSAYVVDNPVSPADLHATMYHALGLTPDAMVHDNLNRPHRINDGRPLTALFG